MFSVTYSGHLGDRYTHLDTQKALFKFLQFYFNKKYVEVAVNDLTMHLLISKLLGIQKCRQKRKTMRQRG